MKLYILLKHNCEINLILININVAYKFVRAIVLPKIYNARNRVLPVFRYYYNIAWCANENCRLKKQLGGGIDKSQFRSIRNGEMLLAESIHPFTKSESMESNEMYCVFIDTI